MNAEWEMNWFFFSGYVILYIESVCFFILLCLKCAIDLIADSTYIMDVGIKKLGMYQQLWSQFFFFAHFEERTKWCENLWGYG